MQCLPYMTTTEPKEKSPDANPSEAEATPLAPGVWVTESTGFAAVPPRAQSDLADVCDEKDEKEGKAEKEKLGKPEEPRIEKYRER
jgi:hypothetical protein